MRQWQPWHLLPPGKSLTISFRIWEHDVFARLWCHNMGIPCQKQGNPLKIVIFGRFRLVMCITTTKLNVTIPVLFKTSIKASLHPLSHHPPHPNHCLTPTPPPSLPTAICLPQSLVKSFRYPPFKSFLKRPPLKETLWQKKFP